MSRVREAGAGFRRLAARPCPEGPAAAAFGHRDSGDANLEEFTERRWLTVSSGPAHYPY